MTTDKKDITRSSRYSYTGAVLGVGSYGRVVEAIDDWTGERVAIKCITNVFRCMDDAKRILREIKLLRLLRHPHIVVARDIIVAPACAPAKLMDEVCIVFEPMDSDLHSILKRNSNITPEHIKVILVQLLRAVAFMHSSGVVHRDIKPRNVLVNSDSSVKLCDLGLARCFQGGAFPFDSDTEGWTGYVATRWYRAPELCGLFDQCYTRAVDVWSVGCVFAEMTRGGDALFQGKCVKDQLHLIVKALGTPTREEIDNIPNPKSRQFLRELPAYAPGLLETLVPKLDEAGIDLLRGLLTFDASRRLTAWQALNHPYLQGIPHPVYSLPYVDIPMQEFEFDRRYMVLTVSQLRFLMWLEVLNMIKDCKQYEQSKADSKQNIATDM